MENLGDIPIIDFSVFFNKNGENDQKTTSELIDQACTDYGFFQAINHGIPTDLLARAMELSKAFFDLPMEEKLKAAKKPCAPVPVGYGKQPEHSTDKNEYLMMLPPGNQFNVLPNNPDGFCDVLEEMFMYFSKTAKLVEKILNDCLGLDPDYLNQYNQDRSSDLFTAKRYFPADEGGENTGVFRHTDPNVITLIFQDEVGGLEVLKDGHWMPVKPCPVSLIVNVGDTVQVLTNGKYKSAAHRVQRQPGRNRHSFTFFYNLQVDKWIEPLARFTTQIGEPPKYRGFVFHDYQQKRIRNKTHPPSNPEDEININIYAVSKA